jgi:hypothetical protein
MEQKLRCIFSEFGYNAPFGKVRLTGRNMTLKGIDPKHFYVDDKLIDLVWITHHANTLVNAANYHEVNRAMHWLRKLAERLVEGDERPGDEHGLRRRLTTLGLAYIVQPRGNSPQSED